MSLFIAWLVNGSFPSVRLDAYSKNGRQSS
jgi:hypothetical protein